MKTAAMGTGKCSHRHGSLRMGTTLLTELFILRVQAGAVPYFL